MPATALPTGLSTAITAVLLLGVATVALGAAVVAGDPRPGAGAARRHPR